MPKSQLTELRARTAIFGHSQLTQLRVQTSTAPGSHSMLTGLRASSAQFKRSQLTEIRAVNLSTTGPTAVITHTAPLVAGVPRVGPTDAFQLSLATSFGGTLTGYDFLQLSGPTAAMSITGDHVDITAPSVQPNPVGFPNDLPWSMVFQGIIEVGGGAQTASTSITVLLEPHLTFAADGSPLFWHL